MKNIVFALIFFPLAAFAQVETWEYCTVNYLQGGFNSKAIVYADYGLSSFKSTPEALLDSSGKADLKSFTEGFNILGRQGWELTATYDKQDIDLKMKQYFVFKRRKQGK